MLKWLVLAVVVMAVLWLLRRPSARRDRPRAGGAIDQALVACARCSVLVPRAEALERDGHLYCCDEHRRLGQAG